ncbi:MAG: hypothetical protein H7Z40_05550 [Phycisphaerae bacterium]|nr:hypothetical protein [Gemmatimonadaceae bacterium]
MSWVSTVITAIITAALGTVLSGYVALMAIRWYRISGFEGKSGYYIVAMALIGLVVGLAVGVVVSRVVAANANPGMLKSVGISVAIMSGLVAVVGTVGRLKADVPPTLDGEHLMLIVEARWPATHTESPAVTPGISYLELGSIVSRVQRASAKGALWKEDAQLVNGRWVVTGAVHLFTERGDRVIEVALNDSVRSGLVIPLPRRPGKAQLEWSEWGPKDGRNGPTKEDGITYRYRVQKSSLPIRTEKIGQFAVSVISNGFQAEVPDGTTTLDPYGAFEVQYAGKPVTFSAGATPFTRTGMIALLPSEKPALLAYIGDGTRDSYCALLVDDGTTFREQKVDDCSNSLDADELTSDSATFAARKLASQPRGRLDRRTFAHSSLLLFQKSVLNARTLHIQRMHETSASAFIPSVPPLGLSPDQSSFVRFNYGDRGESEPMLLVVNFARDQSYSLPIDPVRMRFDELKALTPTWLMHHFHWQRNADGTDMLTVRPDFLPIPYYGTVTDESDGKQAYRIQKAGQKIRLALLEHLEKEFKVVREAAAVDDYEYPVTVDGQKLKVASSGDFGYVMVSMDHSEKASDIVARIGKSFNDALATGRFDELFVK